MKILLAIFLSATLGFAETAPAPAEGPQSPADGGELVPSETDLSQADVPAPISAEVRLADGSVIKGVPCQRAIQASSGLLGRFSLDLESVGSITFDDRGNGARIAFRNGDILTATLEPDGGSLALETVLGQLSIPLGEVSSIMIAGDAAGVLLYHCTFDSAESIKHPAAGPSGTFLGGEFVPGKKGRALLVKAGMSAAEVSFPVGLMKPEGCIEFWAKIPGATKETTFPDGGNPQFFAMAVGKWVNTFVKFTANDGFGTGGLHADLPGSAYVSSSSSFGEGRYPAFLGDPAAWHHYALVWSENGLDAASEALGRSVVSALYVDGRLLNPAYGTNGPDRAMFLRQFNEQHVILGFPFLRGRQQSNQSQVEFLIDEFKIWSKPVVPTAASTGP